MPRADYLAWVEKQKSTATATPAVPTT